MNQVTVFPRRTLSLLKVCCKSRGPEHELDLPNLFVMGQFYVR